MEERRPHLDARPRNSHTNHRGPVDGELPPRAEIMPLHSSLGDRSKTLSQKKKSFFLVLAPT
uniref:ZNFX1 protein n=1 Tax=Homo sapiens TaxID=9606 RepID=Q2TAK0_HUMAN|nr:ZNFX1 protein [Homo sapiens]